jgi:hypothetical protein
VPPSCFSPPSYKRRMIYFQTQPRRAENNKVPNDLF